MTLPKKVKIGALQISIRWVKDLNSHGQYKHNEAEILLDESIRENDAETLDTFLHECLHAMDYANKLDLGEDTVHRLAFMLTAFLVDNNLVPERLAGGGKR